MTNINLKLTLRNIYRNKLHSLINIIGFAIGIAVFMLIVRYADHQFSFDAFHKQHSNIYKVHLGDNKSLPPATAQFIMDNVSGIDDVVRIDEWYGGGSDGYLKNGNEKFKSSDLLFVDDSFFEFFDFNLIYGDSKEALRAPNTIILSESYSRKLFGNENPVGKQIEYISNYPSARYNFTVMGVVADAPSNSSIVYNGLISMPTIPHNKIRNGDIANDWSNWGFGTYIKTSSPAVINLLNAESPKFWTDFVFERWQARAESSRAKDYKLTFVPLKNVHFESGTKRSSVYLMLLIAFVILSIAIINYINLSIAIATTRIKEIGIRKVIGSDKGTLFRQFLTESIIVTTVSAVFAVFIMFIVQPYLHSFTGFNTIVDPNKTIKSVLLFVGAVVVIGMVSGMYPAWYLTNVAPLSSLKNEINRGKKGATLKHMLIVTQFVVSIFLIIAVISISKQVSYMNNKELGFDKEHILYLSGSANLSKNYKAFRASLLKIPNIKNVARSNGVFAGHLNIGSKHKVNGEYVKYKATTVDPDFIETFGMELVEGRNFSWNIAHDLNNTALVNECFVKKMNLKKPIGSNVTFLGDEITIVGVIKDFHINSLHNEIEPSMLSYLPWNTCINIKISGSDIKSTLATIEDTWNEFLVDIPFEYHFLNEDFEALYKTETTFSSLIKIFSIVAVLIASLGLFGLISFSAIQRKKEIGIRKVNGAKIGEVMHMLNRDIIVWIMMAFFIASPVAYFAMNRWLENFAYKTTLSWWIFALAGCITLLIALFTVSWQTFRAARRNPVEALRYE